MDRIRNLSQHLTQGNKDIFGHLQQAPPDPILGIAQAYKASQAPKKVNLGIGAYRDDDGKPYVFQIVRKVEEEIVQDIKNGKLDKEYLPIEGLAGFRDLSQKLIFGEDNPLVKEKQIVTIQSLSGTGSLRVGFEFLRQHCSSEIYISKPTWANHHAIAIKAGLKIIEYPYWNPKTKGLDIDGMLSILSKANPQSILLLHSCAHNPTGVDPTQEQWLKILQIVKEKQLIAFFDSAYQGYASGNVIKDVWSIRKFVSEGVQVVVAQSYAKNFGLYGERVGALHFVCGSQKSADILMSQVRLIVRPMYSNPPLQGARIVERILGNKKYREQWEEELKMVAERILKMRSLLKKELENLQVKGNWDHITNQIGMFSYTGLNEKQCEILTKKWNIYLVKNGRISMAGVNTKNVPYLAQAIKDAINSE